jgi:phospholipid transport system transporter-binding protein
VAETAAAPFRLAPGPDGNLAAHGPLTFATARAARLLGLSALKDAPQVRQIDCAGVNACDSAGLAVLLDWLAAAKLAGRSLSFTGLPSELMALGRISDLDALLARGVSAP